jgi:hypothetical protein
VSGITTNEATEKPNKQPEVVRFLKKMEIR